MSRGDSRFARVIVASLLMLSVMAATAMALTPVEPYSEPDPPGAGNADCLHCHEDATHMAASTNTVAFSWQTGTVAYSNCKKCHRSDLVGTHPNHNIGMTCGGCHPGWGSVLFSAVPAYVDATAGSFAASSSLALTSDALHQIHMVPRWQATADKASSRCGSCHQKAACGTCHGDAASALVVAPLHNQHPLASTITTAFGYGVVSSMAEYTVVTSNQTCGNDKCHDIAGQKSSGPVPYEAHISGTGANPRLSFYPSGPGGGVWKESYKSSYTYGRQTYSASTGAYVDFTFTGQQIELYGDIDPYRGRAQIFIDPAVNPTPVATIDQYSSSTKTQQKLWTSGVLSPGNHVLRVRVTGTKSALARSTIVAVDQFKVRTEVGEKFNPTCWSCHPSYTSQHDVPGDPGFAHEATASADDAFRLSTQYPSFRCDDCHDMTIGRTVPNEHKRTTSSTQAQTCEPCHTDPTGPQVPSNWSGNYDYTCGYTNPANGRGCHDGGDGVHSFATANHGVLSDAVDPGGTVCRGCHAGNLAEIHNNSITTNDTTGNMIVSDCLSCHSSTQLPSTKSCVALGCHAFTSFEAHPVVNVRHDAASAQPATFYDGGYACVTCHDDSSVAAKVNLQAEHQKASIAGGSVSCTGCHGKAYYPRPWDTAGGADDRYCADCHAAGQAASPIHGAYVGQHQPDTASQASCSAGTGCHGNDMGTMHVNSVAGNTMNPTCLTCHTTNTGPPALKTSCAASGCHPTYSHGEAGTGYHKGGTDWASCNAGCHTNGTSLMNLHGSNCNTCHYNTTRDPVNPNLTWTSGVQAANSGCTQSRCHPSYSATSHNGKTGIDTSHTASAITASTKAYGGAKDSTGTACTSYCHVNAMGGADLATKGEHDATYDDVGQSADGRVTCLECHTSSEYAAGHNAFETGKNCSACHADYIASSGTHGAVQHDFRAQTANQDCWNGCHGSSQPPLFKSLVTVTSGPANVAELHGNASILVGATTYRGCNVCHRNGNRVVGILSGRVGPDLCADCHADHGTPSWNHTSDASAYSPSTESGCTGAGAGCHGTSTDVGLVHTGTNYSAGCSMLTPYTCHNSTGTPGINSPYSSKVIGNHQCVICHDSTLYPDTPNANPLTGVVPNGHYAEPVHAAASMTASLAVTGGSASARCQDCHKSFGTDPQGLYGIHRGVPAINYGPDVACQECHTDPNNLTGMNPSAVVKSDWNSGSRLCSNCHTVTSSAPMGHGASLPAATGTSPLSCGASSGAGTTPGCHNSYNLHQLHRNVGSGIAGCSISDAGKGGGSCHDLTAQVAKPSDLTCGGATAACHKTYLTPPSANGMHDAVNATSDPLGQHNASATYMATSVDSSGSYTKNCTNCHSGWLGTEHAVLKTVGSYGSGGVLCFECHNSTASLGTSNPNAVVWSNWNSGSKQCNNCHAVNQSHSSGNTVGTVGMHAASDSTLDGTGEACTSCHTGFNSNLAYYHSEAETTAAGGQTSCNVCHNGAEAMQFGRVKTGGSSATTWDCRDCHGGAPHMPDHMADKSGEYNGITYDTGRNLGCFSGCHYTDLRSEHGPTANRTMDGVKGSSSGWCTVCHTSADQTFGGATAGAYAGSAAVRASVASKDRRCVTCHNQEGADNASATSGGAQAPHRNGYAANQDGANIVPTNLTAAPNSLQMEFGNWAALTNYAGGGHNSFGTLAYPVNNAAWPWSATMKSGWTGGGNIQSQKVLCSDCHLGSGGTGPQGASVPYGLINWAATGASTITRHNTNGSAYTGNPNNMTMAVAGDWYNGTGPYFIPDGSSTANNTTESTHDSAIVAPGLCNKCHATLAGPYHGGNGGHNFPYAVNKSSYIYSPPCITCHIKIPHAWKRPRLLRRVIPTTNTSVPTSYRAADALPYADPAARWSDSAGTQHLGFRGAGAIGVAGSGGCNENLCEKHGTSGTDLWP